MEKIQLGDLTTTEHILKIYDILSKSKKDLCFDGIIYKIEDEYKYKESLIREVIEKHKNSNISSIITNKSDKTITEIKAEINSESENTIFRIYYTLFRMHKDTLSIEDYVDKISKDFKMPEEETRKVVENFSDQFLALIENNFLEDNGSISLDYASKDPKIFLENEKVSDPKRINKSFFKLGIKHAFKMSLLFVASFIVYLLLRRLFYNSPAPIFIINGIFFVLLIGSIVGILKGLKIAIKKPDQTKPDYALREFLVSIDDSIYERAYNLLTDNAQIVGNISLPKINLYASKMPEINFTDLDSFSQFWSNLPFAISFDNWRKSFNTILSTEDYCVISVPIKFRDKNAKNIGIFENRFILVRRFNAWFLSNGFIWPF
jgi:hypothetical protein